MSVLFIFLSLIISLILMMFFYFKKIEFGKFPSGERLMKIQASPNYKNGKFQNIHKTSMLTKNFSYYKILKKVLFGNNKPLQAINSTKTDLVTLDPTTNALIWFGHSSYFIQVDGKKILVDPIFSGSASPLPFGIGMKAFRGTDRYTTADMPDIDYLIITHDHWDHLDYDTIINLKSKVKKIICPLGVGEHLEYWGFGIDMIIENDWYEVNKLDKNWQIHALPTRHFSGRTFIRNKSLWSSFMLETGIHNIYIGGDSGYDSHFADIGRKFAHIDVAILENGQYNKAWKYIHMLPNEFIKATRDLKAKKVIPVHNSKFALAYHRWNTPLKKITKFNKKLHLPIITPMIGEIVYLDNFNQQFSYWWVK